MLYTAETKSQLAKLLAEENIHVEHRKTKTAYFDLSTRTLVCPIWKNMSGVIYDLLMGHEVGHALHTPPDGWHEAIAGRERSNFKFFLNILEDARIEKLMKRRFPGLTASFLAAYSQLHKENFFGVQDKDVTKLPLIDRLNLFAKGGSRLTVSFSPEEMQFVTRMEKLETWEQVYLLAQDLYAQAKQELNETKALDDLLTQTETENEQEDNNDNDDEEDMMQDSFDTDFESSSSDESDELDESDTECYIKQDPKQDPTSYTDEFFRKREESLLSTESLDLLYVTLPRPNLKKIVTPVADVVQTLKNHYNNHNHNSYKRRINDPSDSEIQAAYTEFMERNDTYVSLLVKEFEMKKAAAVFRKSKQANTGDLNITKLYRYKLLDDVIFKKRTKFYKGKSHGIVLLLDKSGSMSHMMQESIEQILVLALFCRKTHIPFAAYSFSSILAHPEIEAYDAKTFIAKADMNDASLWDFRGGDLHMGTVSLREIVHSQLSAKDFHEAVMYQSFLAKQYDNRMIAFLNNPIGKTYSASIPDCERLQSTPLNEALVVMKDILVSFREHHHVDLAHLIIVQDGDSDGNYSIMKRDTLATLKDDSLSHDSISFYPSCFSPSQHKMALLDESTQQHWIAVDHTRLSQTAVILKWLRHFTGVQVFGIYVIPSSESKHLRDIFTTLYRTKTGSTIASWKEASNLIEKFKEERYMESYMDGYTRFSFLYSKKKKRGQVELGEKLDELLQGVVPTKVRVTTAFTRMFEKKAMNRLLATKFIPLIAEGGR